MTVRMLSDKQRIGKVCQYRWFDKGQPAICGEPAVAKVGMKPVCQEHMNYALSNRPTPVEKPLGEIQHELG